MSDENRPSQATSPPPVDYVLLVAGVVLLVIPLVFIAKAPGSWERAEFFLRVVASIGGALAGASLPGILHVQLPFARAGGALGIFLLIFATNPTSVVQEKIDAAIRDVAPVAVPAPTSGGGIPSSESEPIVGWAYVGTFRNGTWSEKPALAVPLDGLPVPDERYRVMARINIRESPPSFPFYRLADVAGAATPGQVAEILEYERLGKDRIWARVRVR